MLDLPLFLIQILLILTIAKIVGWGFQKLNQPQVIGEMIAGILLGPSFFGLISPALFEKLFSEHNLAPINAVSQVGLILFMFLIGLELNPQHLKQQGKSALIVGHASIVVPFILGSGLAYVLYPKLSLPNVPLLHYALFLGSAMSITAFPILARILNERKLINTRLGLITISSAAMNDVFGWILLAVVVLMVRTSGVGIFLVKTLLGVIFYLVLMLFVFRPLFKKIGEDYQQKGKITQGKMIVIFLFIILSSLFTEILGIHALFGAFFAGLMLPKEDGFVTALTEKIFDLVIVFMLPLFFSSTGLKTRIDLITTPQLWLFTLMIIFVAVAGKIGGSMFAAKMCSMTWREAGAVGALMNTRGLMELVLLNVGLEIGVISPVLFAMMVIMAIVTTLMTSPLLEWIYFRRVYPAKY